MKKIKKFIPLIVTLLFLGLIIGSWLSSRLDKQPNNPLAKAIKKELGDRVIWNKKNGYYTFVINDNSREVITDIVNVANNYLNEAQSEYPNEIPSVHVRLCESVHRNGYAETVAYISNYIEEAERYDSKIVYLSITGVEHGNVLESIYNTPASYTKIKDIRKLNVDYEHGINWVDYSFWHLVWPDLEYINDCPVDDLFVKAVKDKLGHNIYYLGDAGSVIYKFLLMDYNEETIADMVEAINDCLQKDSREYPLGESPTPAVYINLYVQTGQNEARQLAELSIAPRYTSECNTQLTQLTVYDVSAPNDYLRIPGNSDLAVSYTPNNDTIEDTYNRASLYTKIKGIKQFYVNKTLNRKAKKEGIDWYKVWPDLESFSTKPGSSSVE